MDKKVSVVIIVRNGEEYIKDAINSVLLQGKIVGEIIVIDNNSQDRTSDILKDYPVRYIKNKENTGFAGGCNQGIKLSKYPYILLLNMDTIMGKDILKKMVEQMENNPDIGCIMPTILNPDGSIQSCGITQSISGLGLNIYEYTEKIFGFYGAGVLLRKKMFYDIGYFDESLFTFYEDLDLSFRIRLSGWKCINIKDAYIIHKGGGAGYYKKYYFLHRNKWIIILRYWDINAILALSPFLVAIDKLSFYAALFEGKGKEAILARLHIIKNFKEIWRSGYYYRQDFKKIFPLLSKKPFSKFHKKRR